MQYGVGRRQSIDLMRIVAAFGIVWAHMQAPGRTEGYVALGLFIILTMFLSVRSLERGGARRFWLGRLVRFTLPWVMWSLVFGALEAVRAGGLDRIGRVEDWRTLLYGTAIHLWFLPWVVLTSPLVVLAVAWLTVAARIWAAAVAGIALGAGAMWLHDHAAPGDPFGQWLFAAIPMMYGILAAVRRKRGARFAPLVLVAGATGIAVIGWGSFAAPFLLSAALLFEAFWRTEITGINVTPVAQLAFGVYLVHPFWMLVWYRLVPAGLMSPGALAAAGAVAVFLAAMVSAWAIRRLPLGRFLA
jgi:peptidoglycan/LPS O-acetylase OafA/YrhL